MRSDADRTLGVILAGGAGSRMGGNDKGWLPLAGKPLIEHAVDRLRRQCSSLLIVANRNLDRYARHAPTIRDEGAGHAGPLAGLAAAFAFVVANRHAFPALLVTVPVDCPDPPESLVTRLHAALRAHPDARCAFVRHAGKGQPLFAAYRIDGNPEAWLVQARSALREHGSPWRWQAALDAIAVDFDEPDAGLHNLNTRHDFRHCEHDHAND